MKMSLAQYFIPVIIAGTIAQSAAAAEPANSVNLGFGGIVRTMPHCDANVYMVEYERLYTPTITLLGRGNKVDYKFDDGNYREDGILRGLDFGARYYPSGGMQGFFTGGSLGYWHSDWSFMHAQGRPNQYQGAARSKALRLNLDLGYRIPIEGTRVSIMPEINIGKFFSSRTCEFTSPAAMLGTPCAQKSEVNVYFFLGIAAGFAF